MGKRPPALFCEPISFSPSEKEMASRSQRKRGPVRTVVLNLTQKILVISCPFRSSLPPERSLRSAHRLSAELRSKTDVCGPMSTRKGQAASVTLLRREQLRSASAPAASEEASSLRFHRSGESSISAGSFFLSKLRPLCWVTVWDGRTEPSASTGCCLPAIIKIACGA